MGSFCCAAGLNETKNKETSEDKSTFFSENNEKYKLEKELDLNQMENRLMEKEQVLIERENNLSKREQQLNNNENQYKSQIQQQKQEILSLKKKLDEKNYELDEKKEPIKIGLNNIGATCYMNATLQCLSNTGALTKYFLESFKLNKNGKEKVMANAYYEVIKNLWDRKNNNKPYSPDSFKKILSEENPLFKGIAANDSKDLINFLLERFHQELNVINKNNNINNNIMENQMDEQYTLETFVTEFKEKFNSPISNLFYGVQEQKSQCTGCQNMKFTFQIYSFLEFPLQKVNEYFANKGTRSLFTNDGKNPDVDLYECFEYHQKVDLMNGENQMYCNICNKSLDAYLSTIIYSLPNYLIINLNRGKGAVYECKVNFPEQLNLYNFVTFKNGPTVYGLYAVICHIGPSSMSGHFIAYCRNRLNNKWYQYNDSLVNECTKKYQYNDGMPYILFYKALTLD